MKNIIIVLIAILFSSCCKAEEPYAEIKYTKEKRVFEVTNEILYDYLSVLKKCQDINKYISAVEKHEKDSISNECFNGYTIHDNENSTFTLKNDKIEWLFDYENGLLDEIGSEWFVYANYLTSEISNNPVVIEREQFRVKCVNTNRWELKIDNVKNDIFSKDNIITSNAILDVKYDYDNLAEQYLGGLFTIQGVGSYNMQSKTRNDIVNVDFAVKSSILMKSYIEILKGEFKFQIDINGENGGFEAIKQINKNNTIKIILYNSTENKEEYFYSYYFWYYSRYFEDI